MSTNPLRRIVGATRVPTALLAAKGRNVELWANLVILTWAAAFLLWQGPGFAVTVGTVFAIWAILAVSLSPDPPVTDVERAEEREAAVV